MIRQIGKIVPDFNFENVTLEFDGVGSRSPYRILHNTMATLHLRPGKILGLLGESGSGKSSLLKLLSGALSPSEGKLCLEDILPQDIILLPQNGVMLEHLTIIENLELFSKLAATKTRFKKKNLDQAIEILEIGHLIGDNKTIDSLSGGELQRISLARVLSIEPKIVLLDEPCAAIGGIQRQRFLTLLKRTCVEAEYGAVIASHDWRDHQLVASDVVFIRQSCGAGLKTLTAIPASEFEQYPHHAESIPYTHYDPVNWLIGRRLRDQEFEIFLGGNMICRVEMPDPITENTVRLACGPFGYGPNNIMVDSDHLRKIGNSGRYDFIQCGDDLVVCDLSKRNPLSRLSIPTPLTVFSEETGRRVGTISPIQIS